MTPDDSLHEQSPPELEDLIHACLEAPDPEAELERRTRGRPEVHAIALRVLVRVRASEQAQPTAAAPRSGHDLRTHALLREREPDLPDAVEPTATDELLEKLAQSPRLDRMRYCAEGEVGRGGMGAVLRIHDSHLNRRLAMKVLLGRHDPDDTGKRDLARQVVGRFLEEAQVTSQLDHPGIVPVHELGLDHRGEVYFTMRLVKGKTASEVFQLARAEQDGWTRARAIDVVLKVCDAMAYANSKRVLHRDLKPANIMVGRFGEVYVMDWGLAKLLGQEDKHDLRIRPEQPMSVSQIMSVRQIDVGGDEGSSVATLDGQQLGTPSYMPPEQARSEALDVRADVYAIGAMLYELLAGRAPYSTPGLKTPAYRVLTEVIDGPPLPIERIDKTAPAELVAVADKAMARDREQRYAGVADLAADLRAWLEQRVVRAYRTGALVELRMWVRRNHALAAALAAAVLLLVAGIAATTWFAVDARRSAHAAEQRAREVESVLSFQEAQWSAVDTEEIGDHLRDAVLAAVNESSRPQVEAGLVDVNFTSIAVSLLQDDLIARDLAAISRNLAEQPLVQARLRQMVAGTLGRLGSFDRALSPQKEALAIRRRLLGDQHRQTLESINKTVALLLALDQFPEAEPLIREALTACRRVLGDDDLETLVSVAAMGRLLRQQRKPIEAEACYREVVAKRRRILGDADPQTLIAINNLGGFLRSHGKRAEAELFVREALDTRRRVLGDDHPETLNSIRSMASLLRSQNQLAGSERFWREAMERSRRVLGDRHPDTLRSINNLGVVLSAQKRHRDAIEELATGEAAARTGNTGDNRLAMLLVALGRAYLGLEDAREFPMAESKLVEAHALFNKVRGPDHPETDDCTRALIDLFSAWHAVAPSAVIADQLAAWKAKLPARAAR